MRAWQSILLAVHVWTIQGCTGSGMSQEMDVWEDTPHLCQDSIDNDSDGRKDCRDPDCADIYVCDTDTDDSTIGSDTQDEPEDQPVWYRVFSNNLTYGDDDDPFRAPAQTILVRTFYIMRTEVTVAMYQECIDDGACSALSPDTHCASDEYREISEADPENYPMNCVTWYQASDFCTWFGGRLPSEIEWEKAATGNSTDIYPWGNEPPPSCDNATIDVGEGSGCGLGRPWPVCEKGSENNGHGLCDMIGNVKEWVEDDIHYNYQGLPANGEAWIEDPRTNGRMVRGGAYFDGPEVSAQTRQWCDIADGCDISAEMDGFGFRCAK